MTTKKKWSNLLYGIALGDAWNRKAEFVQDVKPIDIWNAEKESEYVVTDDTQMTLFLADELLTTGYSGFNPTRYLLKWHQTQTYKAPLPLPKGLSVFESLYDVQAPGATCMASCEALCAGHPVENDSMGCGTVMRAAPFGMLTDRGEATKLATQDAQATHLHWQAAEASSLLADIHWIQAQLPPHTSTCQRKEILFNSLKGETFTQRYCLMYWRNAEKLEGWTAVEALARALWAVNTSEGLLETAMTAGAGLNVDSDSVGSIACGIASWFDRGLPPEWKKKLNVHDAIECVLEKV